MNQKINKEENQENKKKIKTLFYFYSDIENLGNININMNIAVISIKIHTVAFHLIIFTPSRGPKGNKLNVAIKAFIKQINPKICPSIVCSKNIKL